MPFIRLQLPAGQPPAPVATRLAREVAQALGLGARDVIVSAVEACIFDGEGLAAGWASAVIHGRDRGPEATARAIAAAHAVLAGESGQAWVSWAADAG